MIIQYNLLKIEHDDFHTEKFLFFFNIFYDPAGQAHVLFLQVQENSIPSVFRVNVQASNCLSGEYNITGLLGFLVYGESAGVRQTQANANLIWMRIKLRVITAINVFEHSCF